MTKIRENIPHEAPLGKDYQMRDWEYGMGNGMTKGYSQLEPKFRILKFAFRIPHSAFRIRLVFPYNKPGEIISPQCFEVTPGFFLGAE